MPKYVVSMYKVVQSNSLKTVENGEWEMGKREQ
jgi:hypothetical protein